MLDRQMVEQLDLRINIDSIEMCQIELGVPDCDDLDCVECRRRYKESHIKNICETEEWNCSDPRLLRDVSGGCLTNGACSDCKDKVNQKIKATFKNYFEKYRAVKKCSTEKR